MDSWPRTGNYKHKSKKKFSDIKINTTNLALIQTDKLNKRCTKGFCICFTNGGVQTRTLNMRRYSTSLIIKGIKLKLQEDTTPDWLEEVKLRSLHIRWEVLSLLNIAGSIHTKQSLWESARRWVPADGRKVHTMGPWYPHPGCIQKGIICVLCRGQWAKKVAQTGHSPRDKPLLPPPMTLALYSTSF